MSDVIAKDFFIYAADFTGLASGSSQTQTINIQADSDFVVQKLTFAANVANAGQTDSSRVIPLCSLLITDTGSGRQLSNIPIDLSTLFGTGEIPFILPQPKVFVARSNISLQLANYDAAQTYNVKLSLIGMKLFRG